MGVQDGGADEWEDKVLLPVCLSVKHGAFTGCRNHLEVLLVQLDASFRVPADGNEQVLLTGQMSQRFHLFHKTTNMRAFFLMEIIEALQRQNAADLLNNPDF